MREITYAQAGLEAVAEEMRRDDKVFYMTTDTPPAFTMKGRVSPALTLKNASPERSFTSRADSLNCTSRALAAPNSASASSGRSTVRCSAVVVT